MKFFLNVNFLFSFSGLLFPFFSFLIPPCLFLKNSEICTNKEYSADNLTWNTKPETFFYEQTNRRL